MKSIGTRIGIGWVVIGMLLMVWAGSAVLAQRGDGGQRGPGGPGGPMMGGPMMGPPIIMKAGAQGVFLLMGNTLTKYDAELTLQKTLTLGDQSGASDAGRPPRPVPAVMLLTSAGDKALVLIGDQFFSVDAASLTVVAKATLPALPPPPGGGGNPPDGAGQMGPGGPGRPPMGPPMPVGLELRGNVLYMLRGPQIIGINITDGTLVGPVTLPKPADQSTGK